MEVVKRIIESGIDLAPGIFVKNNKHTLLNKHTSTHGQSNSIVVSFTLYAILLSYNKERSPLRKVRKLISVALRLFRTLGYIPYVGKHFQVYASGDLTCFSDHNSKSFEIPIHKKMSKIR